MTPRGSHPRPDARPSLATALALASLCLTAAPASAVTHPVQDHGLTKSRPRAGKLLACATGRARVTALPWVSAGRWNPARKPIIDGSASGHFPVSPHDNAYPYVPHGQGVADVVTEGTVPRSPRPVTPRCVNLALPIGVARNGVWIMPPVDVAGHDLIAREVRDRCGGTVDSIGHYHYRAGVGAPCLLHGAPRDRPSGLIGWARDGYPIFGPRGAGGKTIHNRDLDACHGRWETIFGRLRYRYRLTREFPYVLGCFRGAPATDWRAFPAPPRIDAPAPAPSFGPAPASAPSPAPETEPAPLPGPPPPPPVAPSFSFATDPGLTPNFDPKVSDYVTRCDGSTPVKVDVDAQAGTAVSVDGQDGQQGTFGAEVALKGGQGFQVVGTATGGSRHYYVRCLPQSFPAYTYTRYSTPHAQFYALTPTGPGEVQWMALFDRNGVPVWFTTASPGPPIDGKVLPDGTIAFARRGGGGFGSLPIGRYDIRRLDGSLIRTLRTVDTPTDFHDMQVTPEGNYLLLTYVPRDHVDLSPYGGPSDATVLDGEIQELAPDGTLLWRWNTKDHISLAETELWWGVVLSSPNVTPDGRSAYDIVHLNSIEVAGDSIVLSARHANAVYEIDRTTGAVRWKLGGSDRPESLAVEQDRWWDQRFGGQHDARILPDGTLTLHDNGTRRQRPPEALRYEIDTVARTATLLETHADPAGDLGTSSCCGSARRQADGTWTVSWGGLPRVTELEPDGSRPFKLDLAPGSFSFRADPIPPGRLGISALRSGMDVMFPR